MKKNKSKILLIIAMLIVLVLIVVTMVGNVKGKKNPVATMEVSYVDSDGNTQTGTIKIELDYENAPESVKNFVNLANNGFYNGLTFHRIISDFMIQGGDKSGDGTGSASLSDLDKSVIAGSSDDYTYSITGEFYSNNVNNKLKFAKGVIGMARSDYSTYGLTEYGYNSASSQFFIVTTDDEETLNSLNKSYASFGRVIEGYDVVEAISNVPVTSDDDDSSSEASTPENAPVIVSVSVETYGAKYDLPETINFDDIKSTVQQYQSYYNSLYSSSSSSDDTETTTTEDTTETTDSTTTETTTAE